MNGEHKRRKWRKEEGERERERERGERETLVETMKWARSVSLRVSGGRIPEEKLS